MKIKSGFILRKVAQSYIVVPVGNMTAQIRGLISLNETGAEIWKILSKEDISYNELIKELAKIFDEDIKIIEAGTNQFIEELRSKGMLDE